MTGGNTADLYDLVRAAAEVYEPAALVTVVAGNGIGRKMAIVGDQTHGSIGDDVDRQVIEHARELFDLQRSETVTTSTAAGEVDLFYDVYPAPPTLIIFGAVHVAQALTRLAKMLGFRVLVNDARAMLATEDRFPEADEVLVAWPDQALPTYTINRNPYIAILTHDPKFDEPA